MTEDKSDTTPEDNGTHRIKLVYIFMPASPSLTRMMQAALVRNVAFTKFSHDPHAFEAHPSVALTWHALEALEGMCIVELVEHLGNALVKPHVPASVHQTLARLVGHRNRISHPAYMGEDDWSDPKMKQFEADGRRYESCVPLVWDLQQAINRELTNEGSQAVADFFVTNEMVDHLRLIWTASMKATTVPTIPDRIGLVSLLQGCRDQTLQNCRDRANGVPPPPKLETTLHRMWAAFNRGEDPDTVT